MADVIIEPSPFSITGKGSSNPGPIMIDDDTGYHFFMGTGTNFFYRKTTNAGASWSGATQINDAGFIHGFGIWAEWWTTGNSGNDIHLVYLNNIATDKLAYRSFDTSSDTLGSEITISTFSITTGIAEAMIAITEARGSNLLVGYHEEKGNGTRTSGTFRSTDNGASWGSRSSVWDDAAGDRILFFPGNETDNQDIWCAYWDESADELSLKTYDDSLDSWSETSISTGMIDSSNHFGMAGSIRKTDNHLILAALSEEDVATGDLLVWDINGAGSIVSKTDVGTNFRGSGVGIVINQNNNDIYVSYSVTTSDFVSYGKSTDGGTTWNTTRYNENNLSQTIREVSSGVSTKAGDSRLLIAWTDEIPSDIKTNSVNSVLLSIDQLKAVSAFYEGTSVATKPTLVGGTAFFKELDTGDAYYWDGSSWLLFSGPT